MERQKEKLEVGKLIELKNKNSGEKIMYLIYMLQSNETISVTELQLKRKVRKGT